MEAKNMFYWASSKVAVVTGGPATESREERACKRRLAQMQKKREKDAARKAKQEA